MPKRSAFLWHFFTAFFEHNLEFILALFEENTNFLKAGKSCTKIMLIGNKINIFLHSNDPRTNFEQSTTKPPKKNRTKIIEVKC